MSVAGGDDVGGQRLRRELAILHRLPETFQDHRRVLRRRHGVHGDRDQPSRRQAWWNSAKMERKLAPGGEQHQSGKPDSLVLESRIQNLIITNTAWQRDLADFNQSRVD